ncbi:MAG: alpha/beta fold hydrolase [Acidimicrobiia bacterium]
MTSGLVAAIVLVTGPFAGAQEHVITGTVLLAFGSAWAALAHLSIRLTDQPQRWAFAPAAAMTVAGLAILLLAPTGNPLGWVWPPAVLVLVAWMARRSRLGLRSRTRAFVLCPVFVVLALAAVGGAYETYRESNDPTRNAMPGRLVSVGDHALHIDCAGTGSPTVVLLAGLGEPSPMMSAWVAPGVAASTRVCIYDRAGRGWSEAADGPQDGAELAADLRTLLRNAGEAGPFVLAGHSAGGIYALDFAGLHPHDTAGVVLLDSMHPRQYELLPSWPGFYELFRRASAVMPSLARLGVGRAVYDTQFDDLPDAQRDAERAFLASPRHNRSVRDEFRMIRAAMDQAAEVETLGALPLAVVTAERGAENGWLPMQEDLATLSSDSVQHVFPDATHAMVVQDEATARRSASVIVDVVTAVRNGTRLDGRDA